MRVIAAAAIAALLAGPGGTCPSAPACATQAESSAHHCCCGDDSRCQCQIDEEGPGATTDRLAMADPWPVAASVATRSLMVTSDAPSSLDRGLVRPLLSSRHLRANPPSRHLALLVFRC